MSNYNDNVFHYRNGEFCHYTLGKLGSSAAAIEPPKQGNSLCEIFGNYGWAEGVRLEKYLADHFLIRGINHFVPHAFSGKEYPDPDCPSYFYAHGNNPQYRCGLCESHSQSGKAAWNCCKFRKRGLCSQNIY